VRAKFVSLCRVLPQESEDEQLARAIAASLGQETTSPSASEPASQAARQVAAAPKTPPAFENAEPFSAGPGCSCSVSTCFSLALAVCL